MGIGVLRLVKILTHTKYFFVSSTSVNLVKVSPIKISRWLSNYVDELKAIRPVGSSLKIICTAEQANVLCTKLVAFEKKPVKVERSTRSNRSGIRGVVYRVPDTINEDDFVKEYADTISKVHCVVKEGRRTGTVFIDFTPHVQALPEFLTFGYYRCRVRQFIPDPIRCYQCQRFGHMRGECHDKIRCAKCGGGHKQSECPTDSTERCVNCGEKHSATFKGCRKFVEEKKIIEIKTKEKVPYAEAAKMVREVTPVNVASQAPRVSQAPQAPPVQENHQTSWEQSAPVAPTLTCNELVAVLVKVIYLIKKESIVSLSTTRCQAIIDIVNKISDRDIQSDDITQILS